MQKSTANLIAAVVSSALLLYGIYLLNHHEEDAKIFLLAGGIPLGSWLLSLLFKRLKKH